jgi:hypothetical protein
VVAGQADLVDLTEIDRKINVINVKKSDTGHLTAPNLVGKAVAIVVEAVATTVAGINQKVDTQEHHPMEM